MNYNSCVTGNAGRKVDDDQRKSTVQQIMQKSTDFLRPEGSHCGTCTSPSGGSRRGMVTVATWGQSNVTGGTTGGTRAESWLYRTVRTPARRMCIGPTHHLRVRGRISRVLPNGWPVCRMAGADSLVDTIFEGLSGKESTHHF